MSRLTTLILIGLVAASSAFPTAEQDDKTVAEVTADEDKNVDTRHHLGGYNNQYRPGYGNNNYYGSNGYNNGYGGNGYYGNGYNNGYGNAGYGNTGYGNTGYGNTGYGNTGYGNTGYGNPGYGYGGNGYNNYGTGVYGITGSNVNPLYWREGQKNGTDETAAAPAPISEVVPAAVQEEKISFD